MKTNSRIPGSRVLAAAASLSLFLVATSSAQINLPVFNGTFTLADQIVWGEAVLPPGSYTVTVGNSGIRNVVLVTNSKGRGFGLFVSTINDTRTRSAGNALLLHQKRGQLCVYSLTLGSLGRVLVFDPALAREAVLEARAPQTVPVMLAKR